MSQEITLLVAPGSTEQFGCTVTVSNPTADSLSVNYSTLPANQPQTYQNFVAVWAASMIPWSVPPLQQKFIGGNSQKGSLILSGLTITSSNSYIVGYGVGPDISCICASSVLTVAGLAAAPTSVAISLAYLGSTSLAVHYQTLGGYLPQQHSNWVGLWAGYASPYDAVEPLAKASVTSSASEGTIALNDVPLAIDSNYTLIYFVGADLNTAAAMLNFSTSP